MKSHVGQFEGGGTLAEFMCVQVGDSERMVGDRDVMAEIALGALCCRQYGSWHKRTSRKVTTEVRRYARVYPASAPIRPRDWLGNSINGMTP
jgi:hypothetical protein